MTEIPLKRKYQPSVQPMVSVAGMNEVLVRNSNDYYAKKIDSGSNHQGTKRKNKNGPKTYDREKHVLWVYPSGRKTMVHL